LVAIVLKSRKFSFIPKGVLFHHRKPFGLGVWFPTSKNPREFGSTLLGEIDSTVRVWLFPSSEEREKLERIAVGITLLMLKLRTAWGQSWITD
jgi:hypothetical protein